MKTIFLLSVLFSLGLYANNDNKKVLVLSPTHLKKTEYTPVIKVKYNLSLSNRYDIKYSLVMPMRKENLSLLTTGTKKNRFDSKAVYQPRFQNLDKVDLVSIVEKSKLYNISKSIQIRTY